MIRKRMLGPVVVGVVLAAGCVRVKTEPIHITVDVNLRVQRELSDFFGDLDAADPTLNRSRATKEAQQ